MLQSRGRVSTLLPLHAALEDEPARRRRGSFAAWVGFDRERRTALRRRFLRISFVALLCCQLLAATVFLLSRHVPPLSLEGVPPAETQRCCGARCSPEFRPPVLKASVRDLTRLEAMTCSWLPRAGEEPGRYQVTLVWSDEVIPHTGVASGVKDKLYAVLRLLRYGRLRDIESFILVPSDNAGASLRDVFFPGTFSHRSTFTVNQHFSAKVPGSLLTYEVGRPVIYSRTWNHLHHFRPETSADGTPLPYISYDSLRCPEATRAQVERHYSVALPWKQSQSGGARKSFAHTMLFEPPELSSDEIEESTEEDEQPVPGVDAHRAPPAPRRVRRAARVRTWAQRMHRWLWGLN